MAEPYVDPPLGLLAELTHRCPLRCPYCSNPVELTRASGELSAETWARVFDEAAELGVLQVHLSGGEPSARRDLERLIAAAAEAGLYTNLITAGVNLDRARLDRFVAAGLDHVQLSFQGAKQASAELVGGLKGAFAQKRRFAAEVRDAGLPLTLNAVVHRQNLDEIDELIEQALELDAQRLEVAHVQYYGWALTNRAWLMPTLAQVDRATQAVQRALVEQRGQLMIDYVVPDYYARRPKPCTGGWGRAILTIDPKGDVLPCHAARTLPNLEFANVKDHSLRWIWQESPAFQAYRGTDWMPEPCRSCERREIDFGGCRCQAMALTGDPRATDPACELSPHHARIRTLALDEADSDAALESYRGFQKAPVA